MFVNVDNYSPSALVGSIGTQVQRSVRREVR